MLDDDDDDDGHDVREDGGGWKINANLCILDTSSELVSEWVTACNEWETGRKGCRIYDEAMDPSQTIDAQRNVDPKRDGKMASIELAIAFGVCVCVYSLRMSYNVNRTLSHGEQHGRERDGQSLQCQYQNMWVSKCQNENEFSIGNVNADCDH